MAIPWLEQKYVKKHCLMPLGIATPVCALVRNDLSIGTINENLKHKKRAVAVATALLFYTCSEGVLCFLALVRPSGLISPTISRERLVRVGPTNS